MREALLQLAIGSIATAAVVGIVGIWVREIRDGAAKVVASCMVLFGASVAAWITMHFLAG